MNLSRAHKPVLALAGLVAVLSLALAIAGCGKPESQPSQQPQPGGDSSGQQATQLYTCPMHPDVRQSTPGKCPTCGMKLVPVAPGPENNK
jgi:hypothetical protein